MARKGNTKSLKCKSCVKNLRDGVQCIKCDKWYHFNCAGVIADECAHENWKCGDCNVVQVSVDTWKEKNDVIEQLKKELEEARKRIIDVEEENSVLKEILREEEEGHGKLWTRVVKEGIAKTKINPKTEAKNKSASVRIIGDSMLRYSGEGCKKQGADVECFPGIRVEQLTRRIENMEEGGHEEVVLLNVGTNNIKSSMSADHLMGEVWDLGVAAKKKFKRAKIVVSGVIRRKDTPIGYIDAINQNIDWACERLGLGFFDPNCWLRWNDLGRDGVHLNRNGSFKMSELLCNVVRHFRNKGN